MHNHHHHHHYQHQDDHDHYCQFQQQIWCSAKHLLQPHEHSHSCHFSDDDNHDGSDVGSDDDDGDINAYIIFVLDAADIVRGSTK